MMPLAIGPWMMACMHRWRGLYPYAAALGILWGLPLFVTIFLSLTLPKHNASGCEGLGFGCSPSPADSVLLITLLASPFLFAAGLLACGAIAVVQWRRSRAKIAPRSRSRPRG
jgi:hypothetical protein